MTFNRLSPALLAACALLGAAALGAQTPQVSMPGFPKPGSPPIVTLLSPGAAPRKALRYAIAANQKATMDLTTTVSGAMNLGGMAMPMDMPAVKLTVELGVTSVATGGDISYDLAVTGMTIDETGTANPTLVAAFQQARATITGTKGTATISNRGVRKSYDLAVSDPAVKQVLTALVSQIESLSTPFPDEAIGAGARWEVHQAQTGTQIVFRKTEYEIVSLADSTVSLKMRFEETGPPQTIPNPILPGTDMNLESQTGSGTGTVVVRLDSLVPTSEIQLKSSMAMSMNLGGQTQALSTDVTSKVTVAPGKGK